MVTQQNPAREDTNGMDYSRCAALHNTILQHGWLKTGRSQEEYELVTRPYLEVSPQGGQDLHPSLLAFLSTARTLPLNHEVNFFYNVCGLTLACGGHEECFPESDQTVTLYGSHMEHASQPDGLVYDQRTHKAIMHFDITDDLKPDQPWQRLETILTVWIEMIQCQKVVALPDTVGQDAFEERPERGLRLIPGLERDPETGAKRLEDAPYPWTIVPWTSQDLENSLRFWDGIVERIERLIGLDPAGGRQALLDSEALSTFSFPEGFATRFLLRARRPRFTYFAPGLRVATEQEILHQPFTYQEENSDAEDEPSKVPPLLLLLLRTDVSVSAAGLFWLRAFEPVIPRSAQCPCGLYLTPCDRAYRYPQENGCSLVLPRTSSSGWARKADLGLVESHDDLLQTGVNPFNDLHPISFSAFLEDVCFQIEQAKWSVDSEGVAGGLEKWCEADTEERWIDHVTNVGPRRYW
ncbi:hypothetical protein KC340_g7170 [Hortaea werneckii]|nr:hypothetical protein KC342_g6132 [Hortaea werneckii]KAI7099522.1 hypothetical protein KC339_g8147 [Hortaea werneckii]KAI7230310.1 hypothetical protein KC365_g7672 [Hortaea werneckii]KAI7322038.1 hypothetical protein KC340_g7170 [Hortaea werneckii]